MKAKRCAHEYMTVGAAFLLAVGAMPLPARSQSDGGDRDTAAGDYDLSWYTVDGGGVMFSTGGDYELSGTIGQPDASNVMEGDDFELTGGFWFRIPPGDCEDDGDVDLNDFEGFEDCLTGPDGPVLGDDCRCFDVNRNGAVDLADLRTIQTTFTSQ